MPSSSLPGVAVVGRPNVGKSTLFNRFIRRRVAIEEPTRGVTRDRLTATVRDCRGAYDLIDTGGFGVEDPDRLTEQVAAQIEGAIREADLLILVVDAIEGILPHDEEVARHLRAVGKPVLLVVNKADNTRLESVAAEFTRLGFGPPLTTSARHNRGLGAVRDAVAERLSEAGLLGGEVVPESYALRLAVVGRRNVGKSTLLNALVQRERVIVSEVPGTTRDAVDVRFEKDGQVLLAMDTPGVRKQGKMKTAIEFFSLARAEGSIRRADVVLFLLDASQTISHVDRKLGRFIESQKKPCVLVINKWDLARGVRTGKFATYVDAELPGLSYAPLVFTTAQAGRNVQSAVDLAQSIFKQACTRVSTGVLNRQMVRAIASRLPPVRGRQKPRFYYATQVATQPPTIVIFVNQARLFPKSYAHYLENQCRRHLPFSEVPIDIQFRQVTSRRRPRPKRKG